MRLLFIHPTKTPFLIPSERKGIDRRKNIPFNKYIAYHFKPFEYKLCGHQNTLHKNITKGVDYE